MTIPKSISGNDDLLSPSEVAKQLNVHRSTVHIWIKDGMLKTERHGAFHGIKREELARFQKVYDIEPPPKAKRKRKRRKVKS